MDRVYTSHGTTETHFHFEQAAICREQSSAVLDSALHGFLDFFPPKKIITLFSFLSGFNTCILVCGNVGSGKSHFLFGAETEESCFLRSLCDGLFLRTKPNTTFHFSMLELYSERVIDLLCGKDAGFFSLRGISFTCFQVCKSRLSSDWSPTLTLNLCNITYFSLKIIALNFLSVLRSGLLQISCSCAKMGLMRALGIAMTRPR